MAKLRAMGSADMPAAASLLAPVMGWSAPLVLSTFGLGHLVLSDVAAQDDEVVGVAHLVRDMPGLPDEMHVLRLTVADRARGHGVGRELWERVLEALPPDAAISARSPADEVRSLAISAGWGFHPLSTVLYQRRVLAAQPVPVAEPVAGVSLDVVRGELAGALHDRLASVMLAGSPLDVPLPSYVEAGETDEAMTTEPTMSLMAAHPGGVVVVFAVADDVDVGYTVAIVEESAWHVGDTSVVPAWRRRGVAALVKAEIARLAEEAGAESLTTHNDADNAPILALNEATGFHVVRRIVLLRRAPDRVGART